MTTKKLNSYKNFSQIFDIILSGNKEESSQAAKDASRYLKQPTFKDDRVEIYEAIETAPEKYKSIKEGWRQENFVRAIASIYFLHNKENQPDFLFPWLFVLLCHQCGKIRYSAVRMIYNEIWPITIYIRFPKNKKIKNEAEKFENILMSLYFNLNRLLVLSFDKKYKKYKYINDLPPSVYKSVQMALFNVEDSCGQKYVKILQDAWDDFLDHLSESGKSEQFFTGKDDK